MTTLTGVLGGTFDPVHMGHLETARAATRWLALARTLVVPSRVPPHRPVQPMASTYHRFAMVALATLDDPLLVASDLELQAPGPSYTSATLARLAVEGFDPLQLVFIVGADAFAEIATWRDYPALLDRAHFAVVSRPGLPVTQLPSRMPDLAPRMTLVPSPGSVPAPLDRPQVLLVDADTPAVSSTLVRDRIARGLSFDDLVPPAVAAYVHKAGLYGPNSQPANRLQEES